MSVVGQFNIFRNGQQVTGFGVIASNDTVVGPWQTCISRQIVIGRQLQPGEGFEYTMYGSTFRSSDYPGCWQLHGAGRYEKKRPISDAEFRSEFEEVGAIYGLSAFRKRRPRMVIQYSRALLPELRLNDGRTVRDLEEGDFLYVRDDGTFGFWPRVWASRFVQTITNDGQLAPAAGLIDQVSSLYDECTQPAADGRLVIMRAGTDVTSEGVIKTNDSVFAPWRATKSNTDLCTARRLKPGEWKAGLTPWGAMLDSGRDGNCYELWPVGNPTDWRLISHSDLNNRYMYVGMWGEDVVYRQKVGTLGFYVTPEMGRLNVQSKEDTEPKEIPAGWVVVSDGARGFYHWSPDVAAKRKWVS